MVGLHEQIETALSGRYQIERELGRGGMAIVYLARDLKHSRRVAVKVLRPELATSLGAERFLREINVAAGLSHPNIVPLYDSGEVDDLLYYVMPYVEGESLRDRLERERQLPIDESLAIARQVASALDHAHAKGVVHRDIKPENILLRGDQVLVADFGLARALYTASSSRLTRSGMAVGTPAYMSPEQAAGDDHVDSRADVYSLACVVYEMVAGVPAFRGATAQAVLAHHISSPPPSLCAERQTCSAALDAAVRRALSKVPADRFRTAGAFMRAVDVPTQVEESLSAQHTRSRRLSSKLWRRREARWTISGAGVVTIAMLLTWFVGDRALRSFASDGAPDSPIRVVMLPLVSVVSIDTAAAAAILSEAANVMRMFSGIVGVALPSTSVSAQVDDDAAAAAQIARAHNARYAAVFAGFGTSRGDLVVDVIDADVRRPIAKIRVSRPQRADVGDVAADIVVGVLKAIAPRDSLFPPGYRSLLHASSSSQAVARLAEGQQRFGIGDVDGARAAYAKALAADSTCLLAVHRLSVMDAWEHRYRAAYDKVDAALRRSSGRNDPATRLLIAQRLFTMRLADSAIAAFASVVADDPTNVDGWFGLSQSMYYFGWVAGHALPEARAPFDRLLALDSAFAPVHGQLVDVALAAGDTAAARSALASIGRALDWRPAKELLVRYASGSARTRDSLLRGLEGADHFTLSELVLQLSRTVGDLHAADRVAAVMESPRMPPSVRRRGAQYRLALSPALSRPITERSFLFASEGRFDPWVAAAALAGIGRERLAVIRDAAVSAVAGPLGADAIADPTSAAVQALEFLVQDALDNSSAAALRNVESVVAAAQRVEHPSNPLPAGWRATIAARSALARADTLHAIALLREATARVAEPYGAFLPLTSLPTQRRMLVTLLRATKSPKREVDAVVASFQNSWSVADAMYVRLE